MKRCLASAAALVLVGVLVSGSPAATYYVNPGGSLKAIVNSLKPGDTVYVAPGTYHEVMNITASGTAGAPITIIGTGATRPIFDAAGLDVSGSGSVPRAVFQIQGSNIVLDNLEMKNARNGDNGSGVRVVYAPSYGIYAMNETIRNCKVTYCDMGMMGGAGDVTLIQGCEVAFNGTSQYDGYSHNFYMGGPGSIVLRGNYIHDALNGQNFKSRAHYNELWYNWISNNQDGEIGPVDEVDTATPNSNFLMVGNTVVGKVRQSGYNTMRYIAFGSDSGGHHNGTMYMYENTLVTYDNRNSFVWINDPFNQAKAVVTDNVFYVTSGTADIVEPATPAGLVTGGNNWWKTGSPVGPAVFTGTVTGAAPGFLGLSGSNYQLTATSACINGGVVSLTYTDGSGVAHALALDQAYVWGVGLVTRQDVGPWDIGAYSPRPGDANTDGLVNLSDLGILAGNYGLLTGMTWNRGDFSGDGKVDLSDLGILAPQYGTFSPALLPEPATAVLAVLGAIAVCRRRGTSEAPRMAAGRGRSC